MPDAFLLSAARTPIGKYLGALSEVPPRNSGPWRTSAAPRRAPPRQVDEVVMGCVLQAGMGQNPARQAALKAGLPDSIAAYTVNKVCGSGLKAVMLVAQSIRAGDAELVLAGGMESMSRAPYLLFGARAGWKFGDQKAVDAMVHDGLSCAARTGTWARRPNTSPPSAACRGPSRTASPPRASGGRPRRGSGAFAAEVMPVTIRRAGPGP